MHVAPVDKLDTLKVYKDFMQGDKTINVLRGIDVSFNSGMSYALTGVSGSGKSTLLHILGGLDLPTSGNVLFNNDDINVLNGTVKEKLLNQKFGFIFQFHYLIKEFTVLENIMMPGLINGQSLKDCTIKAEDLLNSMGMLDKKGFYPGQLSGGQQQRVAIGRAIFNKPAFLFADEPTGSLDYQNAQIVVDLMLKAKSEWGMGIVLCSHDPEVYGRMDIIYNLHEGILTQK